MGRFQSIQGGRSGSHQHQPPPLLRNAELLAFRYGPIDMVADIFQSIAKLIKNLSVFVFYESRHVLHGDEVRLYCCSQSSERRHQVPFRVFFVAMLIRRERLAWSAPRKDGWSGSRVMALYLLGRQLRDIPNEKIGFVVLLECVFASGIHIVSGDDVEACTHQAVAERSDAAEEIDDLALATASVQHTVRLSEKVLDSLEIRST